jgi:hypothetical protein
MIENADLTDIDTREELVGEEIRIRLYKMAHSNRNINR